MPLRLITPSLPAAPSITACPRPGVAVRVVRRPHHPVGAVEEVIGVAVAVDVVAGRDQVGARVEDVLRGVLGDPQAAGRVLAVDDDVVGPAALAQLRHRRREPAAARAADDVADEEDPHRGHPIPAAAGPRRRSLASLR